MNKAELRQVIQTRLKGLSESQIREKSRIACEYYIKTPEFQNASVVMAYLSLPHEVQTAQLILCAWQNKKTVVIPKVSWQQRHMIPVEITSLDDDIKTDRWGLRNPVHGVPVPLEDIDLVITPGLGFDDNGNRLGRGGAYYDRFFANANLTAKRGGLAFSEQIVEVVPVVEHDKKIDFLVTDNGIKYFK